MCTVEGERKRAQGQGEQQWHRRRRTCQCRRWTPRRAHCLSSCAVTGAPQKASKRSLGSLGTGPPLRYGRRGARCDMAGAERSNRVGFSGRCAQTCASVPRFSLGRHFSVVLSRFPLHLCTRADREKSLFIVAAGTLAASATLVVWRWDAADFSRPRPCWCWCQHRRRRCETRTRASSQV